MNPMRREKKTDVLQQIAEALDENIHDAIRDGYMIDHIYGHENATVKLFKHRVRLSIPGTGTFDITVTKNTDPQN